MSSVNALFLSENFHDGEYSVTCNGKSFKILIRNSHFLFGFLLVGFHGAIEKRLKTEPPYFYFKGISDTTEIPLLSISDPSLELGVECNLSWYMGNEFQPKLQESIADFLDQLSSLLKVKLILSGGSGGGFAALSVQSQMKEFKNTTAFVWNPQIYTYNYNNECTIRYLCQCFPSSYSRYSLKKMTHNDLVSIMRDVSICEVPSDVESEVINRLIFINGFDQNHLRKQIRPFVKNSKFKYIDNDSLIFDSCFLHVGEWGAGHVAPGKVLISSIIKQLALGVLIEDIDFSLSIGRRSILDFSIDNISDKLFCDAVVVSNYLHVSTNLNSFLKAYQQRFMLKDKRNRVVANSGYILGSQVDQVFFDIDDVPDFSVFSYLIEVCVEDFFGREASFSFPLNKIIKQRKVVKVKA